MICRATITITTDYLTLRSISFIATIPAVCLTGVKKYIKHCLNLSVLCLIPETYRMCRNNKGTRNIIVSLCYKCYAIFFRRNGWNWFGSFTEEPEIFKG